MIIDIHIHCYPDDVADRSTTARSQKFRIKPKTDGTIAALKASMAKAGVNLGVLQPIAMKPEQTIKMNKWAATRNEEGVISFGTVHPDFCDWKNEISRLAAQGFKGIKFHADCQGYFADDPHMLNIYEEVFNAGLIILFHSGLDRAFTEPFHCTPLRLSKVLDTFPGATMIAAHMGGFEYWDDVEKYLLGRDIYLDTAYSIPVMGKERTEKFIKQHGAEKVLFGTDSPWSDQAEEIARIRTLNLQMDEINGILGNNAKRILQIT
jgi:predicted TIM-barrel fold metal-dependent hydrolase